MKGHAFEIVFDKLLAHMGVRCDAVGGDTDVDRVVNGFKLQLKTPTLAGTRGEMVQYKTHKTHGAKSQDESMDYYSARAEFPDFLIGLVTYKPLRILFLRRDELPVHADDPSRIKSPFDLDWKRHGGLNASHRIGLKRITEVNGVTPGETELLPLTSKKLGLASDIILDSILKSENFRVWDMNVLGFAREFAFRRLARLKGVTVLPANHCGRTRAEKADLALTSIGTARCHHFQVKGATYSACKLAGRGSTVALETQLSRGRVNDHPTQSRLYLKTDFDSIIACLEPPVADAFREELGFKARKRWAFFSVPTSLLEPHPKMPHRLKSMQHISYETLVAKHEVSERWLERWR